MILKDMFYNNLKELINYISDNDTVDEYISRISDPIKKSEFQAFIDELYNIYYQIDEKYSNLDLFTDIDALISVTESIRNNFPDYTGNFYYSRRIITEVIKRTINLIEGDDEFDFLNSTEELDLDLFKIDRINRRLEFDNYIHEDKLNIEESIILISFDNIDDFIYQIHNNCTDVRLLMILLSKLYIRPDDELHDKYCFYNITYDNRLANIMAFLELKKVTLGEKIHYCHEIVRTPSVLPSCVLRINNDYQQFKDVVYILSEYNDKKDILDKYVRIYQVIENFTFRRQVCEIVNRSTRMFSIREFMYKTKSVQIKEEKATIELFKSMLKLEYTSGCTFKKYAYTKFQGFIGRGGPNVDALEGIIQKMGIINDTQNNIFTYVKVEEKNIDVLLAQIVYQLRCSIVHNKETEYHISHNNLKEPIVFFLNNFLFEILEEIIFFLIINKNQLISYDKKSINLYE